MAKPFDESILVRLAEQLEEHPFDPEELEPVIRAAHHHVEALVNAGDRFLDPDMTTKEKIDYLHSVYDG